MDTIISTAVAVAAATLMTLWVIDRRKGLRASEFFVQRFVSAAQKILDDPTVGSEAKSFIAHIAPYIDEPAIGRTLGLCVKLRCGQLGPDTGEVEAALAAARDQREAFVMVLFFFLLALSYRDPTNGWRIRRKLAADMPRATPVYARSADRLIHRQVQEPEGVPT